MKLKTNAPSVHDGSHDGPEPSTDPNHAAKGSSAEISKTQAMSMGRKRFMLI